MEKEAKNIKLKVTLSYDLIQYLGKTMPNGFSRWEAYAYLLKLQKESVDISYEGGLKISFLAIASELGKAWNWHRNSVSSFLKTLENDGAIELKPSINGNRIRVLNILKTDA